MNSSLIQLAPLPDRARQSAVRAGVRVEIVTVVWMAAEALVAITAGILARSVLLTAFGIDSVIELITGGTLLWRLCTESRGGSLERVEKAENRAAWITGIGLAVLCLYVLASAAVSLLTYAKPDRSYAGIGLAVAALIVMPVLVRQKRSIAARIDSAALRADAACSLTCAYMAGALLVGLGLNALFHWWWADALGALALLYWLIPEAREALNAARAGRGPCGCNECG